MHKKNVDFIDLKENGGLDPGDVRCFGIMPLMALCNALERFDGVEDDAHSLQVIIIERIRELSQVLENLENKADQRKRAQMYAESQ